MDELGAAFDAACRRFDGSDFSQLDEIDQILVTIWGLKADVNSEDSGPWEELDSAFFDYPDDISALLTAFLQARHRLPVR